MVQVWAMVRLILGLAQIMGATATLYFLLQTGRSNFTWWAAAVTLGVIVLSRLLFTVVSRKE